MQLLTDSCSFSNYQTQQHVNTGSGSVFPPIIFWFGAVVNTLNVLLSMFSSSLFCIFCTHYSFLFWRMIVRLNSVDYKVAVVTVVKKKPWTKFGITGMLCGLRVCISSMEFLHGWANFKTCFCLLLFIFLAFSMLAGYFRESRGPTGREGEFPHLWKQNKKSTI